MTPNVGNADRIIRIILGVFLLSLTMWGPQTLWGLVGIVLIVTAFVKWCPIYAGIKVSTVESLKTEKLKQ